LATAHSLAAKAYELMRSGRIDEAIAVAENALRGVSTCSPTHGLLASLYLKRGQLEEAERVVTAALALPVGVADAYDGLAYVSLATGHHERANTLYRQATQLAPREPRFWYNLAGSERSLGRLSEAESACDRAISIDAAQFPTYLLRSELRVQDVESNHVPELQKLLNANPADHRAQVFLGYALAKELDDLGRFDEAFHWFAAAAGARRSRLAYEVGQDEQKLAKIARVFADHLPSAPTVQNERMTREDKATQHIFIVGLPRSGTTLVERLLTGLAGVRSNGETENFSRALLKHSDGSGDVFERAASANFEAVAKTYEQLANPFGRRGAVIEKLPMNYLYLGAIRRALPEAKLILLRRSPLDSCFAMYRTLFGDAYPFSYDLNELGRYYAAYERLIDHWRNTLKLPMLEVVYEELVARPSAVGAQIAAYCEVPWDDSAIHIQENRSASLTASASQIRRPIYGSSSGRWRRYEKHLAPLMDELQQQGVSLPA
jgi:tetratricopeptide (TPR) repeat protein